MSIWAGIIGAIIPPEEASPEKHYAWRVRIAFVSSAGLLLALFQGMMALGLLPIVYPGFARANELASISEELRQQRVSTLDSRLLDLRIKHCGAQSNEAKQLYWSKIAASLEEYQKLAGHPFPLPACSDL